MTTRAMPNRHLFSLFVLGLLFNVVLQFDVTERFFNSIWEKQSISTLGHAEICKKPELSCAGTSPTQLRPFFFTAVGTSSSNSPSVHAIPSEHPKLFIPDFLAPPAHLFSRLASLNLHETRLGRSPPGPYLKPTA